MLGGYEGGWAARGGGSLPAAQHFAAVTVGQHLARRFDVCGEARHDLSSCLVLVCRHSADSELERCAAVVVSEPHRLCQPRRESLAYLIPITRHGLSILGKGLSLYLAHDYYCNPLGATAMYVSSMWARKLEL